MTDSLVKAAPPVSVVILTMNEVDNIGPCLESCKWCDDVHVVDSGSTDGTCERARAANATVHHHPFTSFGQQRNWAIDHIAYKHDWIFHLDADEKFTDPLVAEMVKVLGNNPVEGGFHVPHKMFLMGRWIRHASGYPVYQARLFHRHRMRFQDVGHGQRETPDVVMGKLKEPYLHYNFSKGLSDWVIKHNAYSSREAIETIRSLDSHDFNARDLLSSDGLRRRRAMKQLSFRMPMRPAIKFLYLYLLKLGILDGTAGFHYCMLQAMYEQLISLKVREILIQRKGGHF